MKFMKGSQIGTASSVARKMEDLRTQMRGLEFVLRNAGLHEDAAALYNIGQSMSDASSKLEDKARATFLAARNGEELPRE